MNTVSLNGKDGVPDPAQFVSSQCRAIVLIWSFIKTSGVFYSLNVIYWQINICEYLTIIGSDNDLSPERRQSII